MTDVLPPSLEPWANFYVIVGSSAGALTGLQFVVISFISERRRMTNTADIGAFGTPIIVHFGFVLLLSTLLSAPWARLESVGYTLAGFGFLGLLYTGVIARRAARATYKAVLDDVIFHMVLPAVAYAMVLVAGLLMPRGSGWVYFAIAGTALGLLFIGIRNAWDTVLYILTMDHAEHAAEGSGRKTESRKH
jgi:hypothetical protein